MKQKILILLVGAPCSGKSTYCNKPEIKEYYYRISQDEMGKELHLIKFKNALEHGLDIIVDRMGFNIAQRNRYIALAKPYGYFVKVVNLMTPKSLCLERAASRKEHPTLSIEKAPEVIDFFFKSYEEPQFEEGIDNIENVFAWHGE